jgi:hypothetical protein
MILAESNVGRRTAFRKLDQLSGIKREQNESCYGGEAASDSSRHFKFSFSVFKANR